MEAVDTLYEYAGYQASMALHQVLLGLGIPLIIALAGVVWRFARVAEDGLPRPLAFYLFSLLLVWWLLSPAAVTADGVAEVRAPRMAVWLSSASDAFTRRAIKSLNARFLTSPFEWERIAAMCGLARVYDPATRENLHAFFESCTRPAIGSLDGPAGKDAESNPLGPDTGLPYERLLYIWRAGPDRGQEISCEQARRILLEDIRRGLETSAFHRSAREALRKYESSEGAALERQYLDQVVRNEWNGPPLDGGEMAAVRASVGKYELWDPGRNTLRTRDNPLMPDAAADTASFMAATSDWIFSFYGAASQTFSDAFEAKQRYYLVTTLAPQLYGLMIMLLLALFPVAGLWALLPGKWTALVHFGEVFVSVKLWPVGWAILSGFSSRRPASEAFHVPGQPPSGTDNVFLAVVLMYFLVPAISFIIVHIATSAGTLPFRQATPPPAGGSPIRTVVSMAARARI